VIADLFYWMMEKVFAPAVALLFIGLVGVGVFYGGRWLVGLGHDVHGQDYGAVVAKAYTPDTEQVRPVPIVTGKGGGVGLVVAGNPESWTVLIRIGDRVETVDNAAVWAGVDVGDTVVVHYKTNWVWGPHWLLVESVAFTPRPRSAH